MDDPTIYLIIYPNGGIAFATELLEFAESYCRDNSGYTHVQVGIYNNTDDLNRNA